jgi:hypothetical protein
MAALILTRYPGWIRTAVIISRPPRSWSPLMFLDGGLMFVDHHTVDHPGFARVVKIQMDASAWFN